MANNPELLAISAPAMAAIAAPMDLLAAMPVR
jgi:hypothetical protein